MSVFLIIKHTSFLKEVKSAIFKKMGKYFTVKPKKEVGMFTVPSGSSARDACTGRNVHQVHGAQGGDVRVNLLSSRSRIAHSCKVAPELLSSEKCQGLLAYRLCLASRGILLPDESWLLCSSHVPWCCYDHIRMGEVDAGVLIATVWAVTFLQEKRLLVLVLNKCYTTAEMISQHCIKMIIGI